MASIKDVAALAGVHRSTVSRIINGEGVFRSDTKRKVEQAMAELNYRPSAIARSLATASSNMTGLLVTYYTGGFFGQMMEQVQAELDLHKKFLITAQGHHSAEGEREAIRRFHALRCEGYVLNSRHLSDDELRELAQESTPFVILDRVVEGLESRCITFDHTLAAKMAVEHLIEQGHRHIGCITGPISRPSSHLRLQGYKEALHQSAISFEPAFCAEGDYGRKSGYLAAEQLHRSAPSMTALFSCSEEMTQGALQYFHEHNVKLPQQLSLISFDSIELCAALYPQVSSVHFPISQMAQTAVELLMCQLNQTECSITKHFVPELRLRQSINKQAIPEV
ncbi:LacI family DNA-binding transcriptional regulator [Photobacterium gaetbulicola]|uniref:LacI family transcription regulator n=1 Tax=Photobacterium gaetbulicola Gung47 TaxID=658445 RepID=A0A0C5WRW7_9GAMM|nr:LacI family DNA-binding transcriptional regulator [Photobacterium gaetbulicola]AJR09923.1 LacI family transcription regulator [Photobacterium gaetbulicola Gung47]PSU05908.1 LacI family DNA-binding transcriptional regulator [Photobacterium gaetbulicola]